MFLAGAGPARWSRIQMSASPTTDEIATAVITAFEKLPKKNKPRTRDDGTTEWIPLAGIVLEDEGLFCPAAKIS